ncbi:MAG: 50S ribosomal protein L7/L12 [Candidatus Beckwithbacteria bacterium GW2011_GWB1_47_15]|uniref:Large ribosomal subunit protein bL12 n=1 Tax=Candidatus Beckwithbacteria bacterium GW2011_GWB1_47_15 TaxID=1618371 RepID=A0A0G1RVZ6_9BACT|nr:MAG: 50S ribosomal protein L7/L12, large subunit ribosomal protein L7/L12 [Candidatus Beckwithbacteria bacterium GW2011_GWC1_49_16]KKU35213.1 MAG: 50S ribosomal protein L7/L12 [Candidatus Beckwithbacteria bacterium GW2011_GWA1_46_30]KKU61509.1 MAG: 50S ribosomal protein L7/L12 [Candidatus Beckwithbacteria bacterium GW2011_GWB1_47_15]KKU71713.1 MAG: 50S ribosomal protein L7/L12 [Candidatus Beckwithbacteria bacterium GW2011_GWA2_47_25]KKW03811.1 MAG: 50S ribosomal protein L7/L12 [Candidatus Be
MADTKKEIKVSASLQKIIDTIEKLSVLELNELVKALENKFGVSAAPTMAVAAAAPAAGESAGAPAAEEKSEYQVVLASAGANKIGVIKALREVNQELGLKEAKDLAEAAPKEVGTFKKEQAEEAKKKLEAAGAQVELK